MKFVLPITLLSGTLFFMGCANEQEKSTPQEATTETAAVTLPADLFATESPTDSKPLSAIRTEAKTGDTITFSGYIGGRANPFTEGRAIFLVADAVKAPACVDDHCQTPWDACCAPNEIILDNSATVQVVDADGAVYKTGIDGQGGLTAGALVSITGKVRQADEAVFLVDATQIALAGD